ncbi:MAG: hypothetical protein EOP45_14825 [Sphingobacteriaceae bacterium]|nr:MAG: hypothetical protein EOP45_14825 [Sphingobacteriaceae bacterium]
MNSLPYLIKQECYFLSANESEEKIFNVLVRKHNEHLVQQQRNRPMKRSPHQDSSPRFSTPNEQNPPKFNKPNTPPSFPKDSNQKFCSYCKKPRHTIDECHKKSYDDRKKAQASQATKSGNLANPTTSSNPTVNLVTPNEVVEPPITAFRENDYSFAVQDDKPLLTQISTYHLKHMPTAVFQLHTQTRKFVKEGTVLLDTGSTISALSIEIAKEIGCKINYFHRSLKGIVADSSLQSVGFAYAMIKHPEMEQTRILKLQICQNFEPTCLIGNSLMHLFYTDMKSDGLHYRVKVHETEDGKPHDPNFQFRFVTDEENQFILNAATEAIEKGNTGYIIDKLKPVPKEEINIHTDRVSRAHQWLNNVISSRDCAEIVNEGFSVDH